MARFFSKKDAEQIDLAFLIKADIRGDDGVIENLTHQQSLL